MVARCPLVGQRWAELASHTRSEGEVRSVGRLRDAFPHTPLECVSEAVDTVAAMIVALRRLIPG